MWKSLLASLLLATAALAQENPSAYEALRVVGTQLNRDLMSRVISVTGVDGDPQPRTWKILVADRSANGGVREIMVEDNRIASQRMPNRSVVGSTEGAHDQHRAPQPRFDRRLFGREPHRGNVACHLCARELHPADGRSRQPDLDRYPGRSLQTARRHHSHQGQRRAGHRGWKGCIRAGTWSRSKRTASQVDNREVDAEDDPEDNVVKRNIKRLFRKTKEDATPDV